MALVFPDDFIDQILCGDALDLVPALADNCLDGVLIDPPYGAGMAYRNDASVPEAVDLLTRFLPLVEPKLRRNGHLAMFWTMRDLDLGIDALRAAGFMYRRTLAMYLAKGSARPYLGWLPRTQAIIIGQKYLPATPSEFHAELAHYLAAAMARRGITRAEVAQQLGCNSRLVMKWTRLGDPAWCLPTPRFYGPLKQLLDLDDRFDIMLTREPAGTRSQRGDFAYRHDTYVVDQRRETMQHPSQKPLSVVEHVVTCLAPKGGVILDAFCGSGTTAVACQKHDRRFIGFDIDPAFCAVARDRCQAVAAPAELPLLAWLAGMDGNPSTPAP